MIQIRGLTKNFVSGERRVEVLSGIDLEVARGERVGIVGSSGAGKTTLMHILGALDRPSGGQVLLEGTELFTLRGPDLDAFRNRTVGFVFQFHQLLPEFSALENVMMPALIARQKPRAAAERAEELLREVGLAHRLSHKPGELSGGEQQRVAIARSLIMSPRLLLADEPTGNLDSRTSEDIYRLLQDVHQKHALTMVVVTHSEMLASRLDRIVHMEDGRIQY
ncbi:MAG: ABC transporter ATP-binding protein [Desulfuromonadales bacterium]